MSERCDTAEAAQEVQSRALARKNGRSFSVQAQQVMSLVHQLTFFRVALQLYVRIQGAEDPFG